MPRLRLPLLAAAVALACTGGPASAQYSNFYFFGDSLTDAGSFKPVLPASYGALFTTNPGPVWAQALGARYGFTITPTNQGGTDSAYGGARVVLTPGQPPAPPTGAAVPIATQVATQVAKGIDPNAVYAMWGGANDIGFNFNDVLTGAITTAQAQANIALAATQYGQQVAILQNAGARYIVVFNLPDVGKTPYGQSLGPATAAQLSAASSLYNTTTLATLNAVGGNQIRVNINAFFNEALANPAAMGFSNVTGSACANPNNLFTCNPSTLVAPNAAQTYLFADGYHPTTAGHAAIAQLVASMLDGPAYMGSLAESPLAVEQANFRALDGRMWSALDTRGTGKLQSWAAYDYSSPDIAGNGFYDGNGSMSTLAAGLDMLVTQNILAGVAFGYSWEKVDFSNGAGGYKLDEATMTFYGGWGDGPWYVGASAMLGDLQYNDVNRNIQIGALNRTETGDTSGYHYAIRVLGGYWFKQDNWVHGPFAKFVWQDATVRQFSEQGQDSSALSYGQQERQSAITSLGWQAQANLGMWRPFGRFTWEWEGKNQSRDVTASSVTLGGSYSIPAYKPDSNWGNFLLGTNVDLGKVTGYISGNATAGKGDGNTWGITVGMRVPL